MSLVVEMESIRNTPLFIKNILNKKTIVPGFFLIVIIACYFLKNWFMKTCWPFIKKFLPRKKTAEELKYEKKIFITGEAYYMYKPSTVYDIDETMNPEDLYKIKEVSKDFADKTAEGIKVMKHGIKCGLQAFEIIKEGLVNADQDDQREALIAIYSAALMEMLDGRQCEAEIRHLYDAIFLSSFAMSAKIDDEARQKGPNMLMKESIRSILKACGEFKASGYFECDGIEFLPVKESFAKILYLSPRSRANYHEPLCTLIGLFGDSHKACLAKCDDHLSKVS